MTNLDDSIDDYDIREKFEKFGHVPLIEVPYNVDVPNRNGSSWGTRFSLKTGTLLKSNSKNAENFKFSKLKN